MIMIDEKFGLGQVVYIITDVDKVPGMITGITVRPGHIIYTVTIGGRESAVFYDFELTTEKSEVLS